MPKCYSQQEREQITRRLKEEATECIARYGIRRTTVDEIVRRVKIPKGTFYLFYESKEQLLFDVILEQHDQVEQKMFRAIQALAQTHFTAEDITELFLNIFRTAEEMPILKVLHPDEIEILARKLPPGILEEHLGHDNKMSEQLFSMLPTKDGVSTETISVAFRALYFSTLHKEEIGKEQFEEALRTLIYGLVIQFIEFEN